MRAELTKEQIDQVVSEALGGLQCEIGTDYYTIARVFATSRAKPALITRLLKSMIEYAESNNITPLEALKKKLPKLGFRAREINLIIRKYDSIKLETEVIFDPGGNG